MIMTQVVIEFDPGALSALRKGPKEFAAEVKTAAVVQWYAEGRVSQSKAAEILGISHAAFLEELFRRKIPTCQVTIEELLEEIRGVWPRQRWNVFVSRVDCGSFAGGRRITWPLSLGTKSSHPARTCARENRSTPRNSRFTWTTCATATSRKCIKLGAVLRTHLSHEELKQVWRPRCCAGF
jgi:predicted HTH domain antitoxin